MTKKTVVIYHKADFDGIFCREIARKFLPHAELIGWDYGDPEPVVNGYETLYMLDISIEGLMMHKDLVWIDHHKSAMEKFHHGIPGYRIDGVAACRLAWQWFRQPERLRLGYERQTEGVEPHADMQLSSLPNKADFVDRKVEEPFAVQLAGEYDIWDKRNPDAELFQHGLRSQNLTPLDWMMLLDPEFSSSLEGTGMEVSNSQLQATALLNQGRCLQYAKTQENESIIKNAGFGLEFEGLKFLACNHARYNSFLFTAGLSPEHDACLGFAWRGGKWTVSLYHAPGKEHHDLSLIAGKHGGGGHRGACGFTCKTLPFTL